MLSPRCKCDVWRWVLALQEVSVASKVGPSLCPLSDRHLRVMRHCTPLFGFPLTHRGREMACMHTLSTAAAMSLPSVSEARWCQDKAAFSEPTTPSVAQEVFFFFICFICHPLSFPAPATSVSLLSLSATHIHCVWSSVGQCSSSEPQDWLADSWKTEGRNCTGSQVLFKMCYWPQNVKGRNSQHAFLPKHELDIFSYPFKHFITHH